MHIDIASPLIGEEEKQAILAVLDSGSLTQGTEVARFEESFAAFHNAPFAVAVNSGTSALIAVLMAYGIGPGDEVIIPAFSFFATASAVLAVNAHPVFADIDPETYCLSPDAVESAITPRTAAIMPVHLYGHLADMLSFRSLSERYGLLLIEDAAQAHGASGMGQFVGSWGTACFSLYATKNITTIEGGMILTRDEQVARKLRSIRNQGAERPYIHEMLGYNFRMTDLAAAMGRVQMTHLAEWNRLRAANAKYYDTRLEGVQRPVMRSGYVHVYHQYTIRKLGATATQRDNIVQQLHERGIGARVYYPAPIYRQPVFQYDPGLTGFHLPETEKATQEVFSIPVHPALTASQRDYIAVQVNEVCHA